jgi:hypothetical protein
MDESVDVWLNKATVVGVDRDAGGEETGRGGPDEDDDR